MVKSKIETRCLLSKEYKTETLNTLRSMAIVNIFPHLAILKTHFSGQFFQSEGDKFWLFQYPCFNESKQKYKCKQRGYKQEIDKFDNSFKVPVLTHQNNKNQEEIIHDLSSISRPYKTAHEREIINNNTCNENTTFWPYTIIQQRSYYHSS